MKKVMVSLIAAAVIINTIPMLGYASDYQGNEKEESKSVFQKLGDLITGKYVVRGEPIQKTGVIQVMAEQVKDVKPAPVR